jgi:hypothetical protein
VSYKLLKMRVVTLVLVTTVACNAAFAEMPELAADGWHTWRVSTTEIGADRCCFEWYSGEARRTACDLDSRRVSFGFSDSVADESAMIQIYAQVQGGEVTKIRALSSQCPVTAKAEIVDLGLVASDDSIRWLERFVAPRTKVSTHALAAISVHGGTNSLNMLVDVVQHDASLENRKDAVFWLVQTESEQAFAYIERLLGDI